MEIIIDGHNDTMLNVIDEDTWLPKVDIGQATDFHIDIEKLRAGGLNLPIFAAFTEGYHEDTGKSLSRTLAILNALYYTEKNNGDRFKIIKDLDEIDPVLKEGKIGAIPSIEGSYCIDERNYKDLLRQFKDLGVRLIGFNWNYSNKLGEGAAEVYPDKETKSQGGLSQLGIKVLKEMEKLGIGIDISHMNEKTFWGVVKNTSNPIIASHSNAHNLVNHRRNLKDEQLRAIEASGGIIGAVLCPEFMTYEEDAYLSDYLDHIEYMAELLSSDSIGLGSDFDGASMPKDLKDSSELGKIKDLLAVDFKEEEVKKILGGNFLRVFRQIDRNKEEIKSLTTRVSINYSMGDRIKYGDKILIGLEDSYKGRLILDGIELNSFDGDRFEFEFIPENMEKFHILSLELEDLQGAIFMETIILYLEP